jgi:hypothetical protein
VPYEVSLLENGPCAAVKWSGEISSPEIQTSSAEIIGRAMLEGFKKVIVDVSAVTNRLSLTELFFTTEAQSKLGPPRPRTAVVGRPDQEADLRFIENVGINRGMPIRVFTSEPEAWDWLAK